MLVRIANREDPDQTASDLDLCCLSRPYWQTNGVQNFGTLTIVIKSFYKYVCNAII